LCTLIASCTQHLKHDSVPAFSLLGPLKNVKRALWLEQEVLLPLSPRVPCSAYRQGELNRVVSCQSVEARRGRQNSQCAAVSTCTDRSDSSCGAALPRPRHTRVPTPAHFFFSSIGRVRQTEPRERDQTGPSARGAWLQFVRPSEPANTSARRTSTTRFFFSIFPHQISGLPSNAYQKLNFVKISTK
jgi:hypothetical protein